MDSDGREVALAEKLVQLGSTDSALDEDDDLVELKVIKELVQLPVLLALLQLDVVLLETVESELGVFIDIVLCGVLHELAADGLDVLGKSGGKHHNLLLLRSSTENILHVGTHICVVLKHTCYPAVRLHISLTGLVEHLVTLIKNEDANASETQSLVADQSLETTGGTDNDVRASVLALESLDVVLDGSTTVEDTGLDVGHVLAESVVLVSDLVGQLTSVTHNNNRDLAVDGLNLLKRGQDKDGSLSQTRLGLADDVSTKECLGNTCLLDCRSRGS